MPHRAGSNLIPAASCLSKLQGHGPKQSATVCSLEKKLKPVHNTVKYLGANLASVHSSDESTFLQALVLIKTGSFPLTWIGGFAVQ
ncbi:hypothetical protein J4Q44_G00186470, partial [Coregonus suidteri]